MACYKINALLSLTFFVTVNCGAAKQSVGQAPHRTLFATEEAADIVAEAAVPLLPTVSDKAAYLIKPGRVPSLGDELGPGKLWIRFNVPQYRRIWHQLA